MVLMSVHDALTVLRRRRERCEKRINELECASVAIDKHHKWAPEDSGSQLTTPKAQTAQQPDGSVLITEHTAHVTMTVRTKRVAKVSAVESRRELQVKTFVVRLPS
jgi:hypothetical protein